MAENSLASAAEAVVGLVTEFSLRKIFGILILVGVVFFCMMTFDRITAAFSLQRIDKSITIMERLNQLDVTANPDLVPIKAKLIRELDEAIDPRPLRVGSFSLGSLHSLRIAMASEEMWTRLLTAMSPWFLVVLFQFKPLLKRVPHSGKGIIINLFIGFLFGLLGLCLPAVNWVDYFLYPVTEFFALLALGVYINKMNSVRKIAQQGTSS